MELKAWSNFLSLFLKALEGNLHHKHVETNQRVTEHNSYPLEYQSFVETPVHQTGQICCQLKNLHLNDLILFIFIISFWMAVDKVRFVSTNNKILIHVFSFLLWEAMLNQSFNYSSIYGMVVYKVEKSNTLMLLQTYCDL